MTRIEKLISGSALLGAITAFGLLLMYLHPHLMAALSDTKAIPVDRLSAISAYAYTMIAGISVIVLVGGGILAYAQLQHLRQDRDAQIVMAILKEYIEDPELFRIRGFVHKWHAVLKMVLSKYPEPSNDTRTLLDTSLRRNTQGELTLNDLVQFVQALEHASFLIDRPFLSPGAQQEFKTLICCWWQKLEEFAVWEAKARGRQSYVAHFQRLAKKWKCAAYKGCDE